jgi:5-oxoprolinase (ATP-hydrolysing)
VTLVGFASDPWQSEHAIQFGEDNSIVKPYSGPGAQSDEEEMRDARIVRGISGEAVHILKELDEEKTRQDLQRLYNQGYRSIAVVLAHS